MIELRLIEQIINTPDLEDEDKYNMIEHVINGKHIFEVGEVVVRSDYSPGDDCDIAVVTYCSNYSLYVMRMDGSCGDEDITDWKTTGKFIDGFADVLKVVRDRLIAIDKEENKNEEN